jgi:hypothetical protein
MAGRTSSVREQLTFLHSVVVVRKQRGYLSRNLAADLNVRSASSVPVAEIVFEIEARCTFAVM